jgi:signal-transduction protein with cAMP-binding, CBS, and nucleotidyltransferase domain
MSEIDLKTFFLEQVRLFENFPADKVQEIVIKSRLATYEGNEAILETGDEGKFIGVVISGHAEISMTDNTGTRSVISQLQAGDVFGVMSLLTGDRIVADVIAGNALLCPDDPASGIQHRHPDQPKGAGLSFPPAGRPDTRHVSRHCDRASPCRRQVQRPLRAVPQ